MTAIPAGTVILSNDAPAAHVIFRQYRKEVCAQCFAYDRGRTLPVRVQETGKVYCSVECLALWDQQQDDVEKEAWRALYTFVQSKGKALVDIYSNAPTTAPPDVELIDRAWDAAEQHVEQATIARSSHKAKQHKFMSPVDPDILAFLLTGIITHLRKPDIWEQVQGLAMDPTPYKSAEDLEAHCNSFLQLRSFLPTRLSTSCAASVCRTLATGGSHNAFGIHSGSDDGEEYMGYGLYTTASYFNHSCCPNLAKRRRGRGWEFWAMRDVGPGEQCCITYLGGDEKELSVTERRTRLHRVWGFECACERCQQEASSTPE